MKNFIKTSCVSVLFLTGFLALCGLSGDSLKDIETAVVQEDYAKAENLANSFIESKPVKGELDEALYYLGLSQLRLTHYRQARATFQLLMSGFPAERLRDKAHLGFIDCLLLEGQYEGALSTAQQLLAKSPKSEFLSLIYLKIGRAHLKLTEWKESGEYLNKIIKEFPNSPEAQLARQLLEEKQYFAVQVGSFLDPKRAEKLVEQLKNQGEYSYIVETIDAKGQKFYRVRVGKAVLLEEAQKLESKLTRLGYPTRIYP